MSVEKEEEVVGCASEQHGMVYCAECELKFGFPACWKYRNRYDPMLIDDEYFKKFGEPDTRRGQAKSNNG